MLLLVETVISIVCKGGDKPIVCDVRDVRLSFSVNENLGRPEYLGSVVLPLETLRKAWFL